MLLLSVAACAQRSTRSERTLAPAPRANAREAASAGRTESAARTPSDIDAGAPSAVNVADAALDARRGAAAVKAEAPADMLPVPGGTFVMGSDDEGEQDERPAHEVSVRSFWLDKTEVTQQAYAECVSAGRCAAPAALAASALVHGRADEFRLPDHPVVGVSWFDATAYCAFRGRRLPTEAEWERAARGSDGRRSVWGDAAPEPRRFGVFGGQLTTQAVASYPQGRGPYGHWDLAGNVWEWVADEYDPYAYRRDTARRGVPGSCAEILQTLAELRRQRKRGFTGKNPIPVECERVLRGGAYNYGAAGLRVTNRVHHPAHFRIAVAGFRCAADDPHAKSDSATDFADSDTRQ